MSKPTLKEKLREEFETRFYLTGYNANAREVSDYWLGKLSSLSERLIERLEVEKVIVIEVQSDEGYNSGLKVAQSIIRNELEN